MYATSDAVEKINKNELRKRVYLEILYKKIWENTISQEENELYEKWIEIYKINRQVVEYYTNKRVLYEMIKHVGNKELCLNSNIRWLYASKISSLLYIFYHYRFFEELKTCYCGLAHFKYRERPPFEVNKKKEWQEKVWTGGELEFEKQFCGYDMGIDLDAPTFEQSYGDARKLFKFLRKYEIKFLIQCSGKKGFHVVVPFEEFKDLVKPFSIENVVLFCKSVAFDIKDKLKLTKIDTVIYSPTRFLKLSFGLDSRNLNVIYPLNDEEFLDFLNNSQKYMSREYVLSQPNLGNMGAYRGRESNPKGFLKMVEEL